MLTTSKKPVKVQVYCCCWALNGGAFFGAMVEYQGSYGLNGGEAYLMINAQPLVTYESTFVSRGRISVRIGRVSLDLSDGPVIHVNWREDICPVQRLGYSRDEAS